MIILSHFLNSISVILEIILQTLILLVTIRVILSWVNPDPYNPIVRFIIGVTDPLLAVLNPFRKYFNPAGSRIDWTPLVLVLLLVFLQYFLVPILKDYAFELRRAAV